MKRLVLLLVVPFVVWAQPEFFGYFESELDIMQQGSQRYSFGYNKLRLDIESRPSDNILIGANFIAQKYWGKTNWNVYDFIPGYADTELEDYYALPDTLFLDNVYMKIAFPWLDLTLGRQQISPGVGYAWNPTDIFNKKSLMDPSYEQTGVEVIRLDIPISNRTTFGVIVQPSQTLKTSTQQYTLSSGVGSFDFSLTSSYQKQQDLNSTILGHDYIYERQLHGGSIIGEFLGWGVWTEFAQNVINEQPPIFSSSLIAPDMDFTEYVIGVDHTFDNSIYLLGEYLHNGFGIAKKEDLTLYEYFPSLLGETHSLMQDYGFVYIMHPTFDYITLSSLVIASFNDKSGTVAPQLDWNAFEDTNISLQSSFSWGEDDTEFGLQDWGIRLRIRGNF